MQLKTDIARGVHFQRFVDIVTFQQSKAKLIIVAWVPGLKPVVSKNLVDFLFGE